MRATARAAISPTNGHRIREPQPSGDDNIYSTEFDQLRHCQYKNILFLLHLHHLHLIQCTRLKPNYNSFLNPHKGLYILEQTYRYSTFVSRGESYTLSHTATNISDYFPYWKKHKYLPCLEFLVQRQVGGRRLGTTFGGKVGGTTVR